MSAPGQRANQWVRLVFDVPVSVREVKLYNPRPGDEANSTIQVSSATVQVCADADCATVAASGDVGNVSVDGTSATFAPTRARAVRVLLNQVSGTFYGAQVAGLAEVEVIARGEAP